MLFAGWFESVRVEAQGVAPEAVVAVHAAGHLPGRVEPRDGLAIGDRRRSAGGGGGGGHGQRWVLVSAFRWGGGGSWG